MSKVKDKKLFEMIAEFHKAFNIPVGTSEFEDRISLRESLIDEEYEELKKSIEEGAPKAHILKELIDNIYVLVGMAVEFDWDVDEALRRVHESNMSKAGPDGKPIFREDGKVLKGPNYREADLEDLV